MAKLNDAQRKELCTLIAIRTPPPDIVEHFQTTHGLDISFQLIYHYRTSKKWSELISEERIAYDEGVSESFLACKRNRLNALHDAYLMAMAKKDAKGAVMAIAQAQKEMEGMKLELTGKDGNEFIFNIDIGPPPDQIPVEPKKITPGPVLTLRPPSKKDDKDKVD